MKTKAKPAEPAPAPSEPRVTQVMRLLQPYLRGEPFPDYPDYEDAREPSRGSGTSKYGRYWFALCALTLIIASDYKIRVRDPNQTFKGSIDSLILIELALYGCVGLYLFVVHGRPPHIRRTQPFLYFACFFVGLMTFSVVYTAYPEYAMVRAGEMCVLLALTLIAARNATRADLHRFAHFFIALVSASVVYGIFVPSSPITKLQTGRFTWLAIHPTVSGVLTGLATVLSAGYLLAGRRPRPGPVWSRGAYWVAFLLVGGGLLATQTRGAVLGAAVAVFFLLFALRGGRALVELQVLVVVVVLGIALVGGGRVVKYFERGETTQQLSSLNSRTDFWATAVDAVERKPMFGYGVTSARGIFFDASGLGGGHNEVINVLVELGLVGLVAWGALVLSLFIGVRRLPFRTSPELRVDRALILAVLAFLLIDGVFYEGPAAASNVASTWLFVCVAWLAVARRSVPADRVSSTV